MLNSVSFSRYAAASLAALVAGITVASAVSYAAPTFAANDPDLESVSVDPQLKLTPEQKQKLRSIAQEYTGQVRDILNPEQRREFAAGLKSKKRLRDILRTLKLTKDQQNQIASARRDAGRKAFAVLTPAQQKLLSSRRN
ncbi:MAG: Spy/CpxP family protein refolding chaperone [Pseudanabaenaceae cyanobacterium]